MLWKKESNTKGAMYIDLFKSMSRDDTLQYDFIASNRRSQRNSGKYEKWDLEAKTYREQGDEFLYHNILNHAIEFYNKSLCFGEVGSKSLGLAYAARAKCFMKMKLFTRCIADIELAKLNGYPAREFSSIDQMIEDCTDLIKRGEDESLSGILSLDFKSHDKYPCLANVVGIKKDRNSGRCIVATSDIAAGKTVLVEQCYIGVSKHFNYRLCSICRKANQNLIPCDKCTNAMFCADCKENDIHEIECYLNFGCKPDHMLMDVIRSIALAKNAFASADDLIACVEGMRKADNNYFPAKLADKKSKYRAFFKTSPHPFNYAQELEHTYLFYQIMLFEHKSIREFFHSENHKRFLKHLVMHHIHMILRGAFNKRVAVPQLIGGQNLTETYINLVANNLKQSSNPNALLRVKDGYVSCVVVRRIKEGEKVLIEHRNLLGFENPQELLAELESFRLLSLVRLIGFIEP